MTLLAIFNLLGVAVFALSGVLSAIRKNFDPIGIFVIATVTGIGGGTLRDLLLGIQPVNWVRQIDSIVVILITVLLALIVIRFVRLRVLRPPYTSLLVADAFGLALFTITGTQIAQNQGVHWLVAIVMGTITGAAGGVIRDVLLAEPPLLFRQTELYATAALTGGATYVLLEQLGVSRDLAMSLGIGLVAAIRLSALRWGLKLPTFRLPE